MRLASLLATSIVTACRVLMAKPELILCLTCFMLGEKTIQPRRNQLSRHHWLVGVQFLTTTSALLYQGYYLGHLPQGLMPDAFTAGMGPCLVTHPTETKKPLTQL